MSDKNTKKRNRILVSFISVCTILLIALLVFFFFLKSGGNAKDPALDTPLNQGEQQIEQGTITPGNISASGQIDVENAHNLGSDVYITGFVPYTGAFMEDRTDEVVTDVLAIQVTNFGEEYIQTMDIILTAGDTQAQFSLSTLFPGETMVVLEKNRMTIAQRLNLSRCRLAMWPYLTGIPVWARISWRSSAWMVLSM